MITIQNESRRDFIKAGAGLTLGIYLAPLLAKAAGQDQAVAILAPNAFVRIGTDNIVTVISKHTEMGQGVYSGLATLVAEELDASWAQIRVEGAPADAKRYGNLFMGIQLTGGSNSIANSYLQMRQAGATARQMLVAAAAKRWQVNADEISIDAGVVQHKAGGHKATFGELAEAAALEVVPTEAKVKEPKDFKLIGKKAARKDVHEKTNGTAQFTRDVKLPGMLTAVVAHPPRFGAKVARFDAAPAKAIAGVTDVVEIRTGVAVLATDFWAAKKGRDALVIEWDETNAFKSGSAELFEQYRQLAEQPGTVARNDGDVATTLAAATNRIEASYEFPYLAHAAMEPMDCVVKLGTDTCEIWNGEQSQTLDQKAVALAIGMAPHQVKLNMLYAGGSFGRRANPVSDYVLEAVYVAKAISGRVSPKGTSSAAPVKLCWTREDDMRAGHYRAMFFHKVTAGLNQFGIAQAWQQRIVGQSIMAGTALEAFIKNGVDGSSVEGSANLPYAIPNVAVELHSPKLPVPVQWWRSVGSTHNAYVVETMLDEFAHVAKRDPVDYRRNLLQDKRRHLGVMNLVAQKSAWDKPLAAGKPGERRGRGIAVHESFNSFVAQVAEVTLKKDGSFRVDRVVCAVDCGVAVNPDNIRAQMEGGIIFGLSAALSGAITFKDGAVEQSNFDDYPVLRMNQTPRIEVHIVPSAEAPTGVGEPGVPPIAPAVANALFAASGKRLRRLPFNTAELKA